MFPLHTAAGGTGAAGKKQMANILCCLCGRSIQPNGEIERPPPARTATATAAATVGGRRVFR